MFNNSYLGGNYYSGYGSGMGQYYQGNYSPQVMTPQAQQQNQYSDVPFMYVGYGTLDEIKAYIVPPTKRVMFIDRDKSQFYVKSADNMGKPRTSDLGGFIRKEDLKGFLTAEDIKHFSTKQEVQVVFDKLSSLENDIKKLNRLTELLGGVNDGK